MYRILLADDEGIMLDAMRFLIEENFPGRCELAAAKTGRSAIEQAERFRPDIALVDIQMPGINGLEAMREMRRGSLGTVFIVVSAYNRFDYAREALPLGVMEYLNKPLDRVKFVDTLRRAMQAVDEAQEKRSLDLALREKLETAGPVIENGLIFAILFRGDYPQEAGKFRELLGIGAAQGFMIVFDCGEPQGGDISAAMEAAARLQEHFGEFRSAVAQRMTCVLGPMMASMTAAYVPWAPGSGETEYQTRVRVVETVRALCHEVGDQFGVRLHAGIGTLRPMEEAAESYREALEAIRYSTVTVAHARDLPIRCEYASDYPVDTEKRLFAAVLKGSVSETLSEATSFYDWMANNYADDPMDIRLKVIEFVLYAEHLGYKSGGMTYDFRSRADYLPAVMGMEDLGALRYWFYGKLRAVCHNIRTKKEESSCGVAAEVQDYIRRHYADDLSLDDVSYRVNISPYYFSKLFKNETGMNFIDYLTEVRMEHAKRLLAETDRSVKEICRAVGYSDPNYFSRSFKKNVGVTPTEYKEGL